MPARILRSGRRRWRGCGGGGGAAFAGWIFRRPRRVGGAGGRGCAGGGAGGGWGGGRGRDGLCGGWGMILEDPGMLAASGALFDGLYEYRRGALLLGREPS